MGDTENIKDNLGEEAAAEKDTETTADEKAETAGKSSSDDDEADAAAEYNDTASEYADMEEALAEANDKYVDYLPSMTTTAREQPRKRLKHIRMHLQSALRSFYPLSTALSVRLRQSARTETSKTVCR